MRPKTKSEIPIGSIVADRYRIVAELGRGGMAVVYEAEHTEIGKRVAVKVLDPALSKNATVIERFHREARAAASVDSANICEVFDVGRLADGRPLLIMELLEGESLYDRMTRIPQFDLHDVVRIFAQVGRGLARAHDAGIVHRDLKPENIFLARDADGIETAKILDFGLAKFHVPLDAEDQNTRLTREGAIFGTPLYMSPEQVSGQGQADHRSDLWAFGCMVFECLTGRPLWDSERGMAFIFAQIATETIPVPSSLRHDLPRGFDVWLTKALARDPNERFQSARELVVGLTSAFGQDPTGLVSAPAIIPPGPALTVIVRDSRAESGNDDVEVFAPTQPPPPPMMEPRPTLTSGDMPGGSASRDGVALSERSRSGRGGAFWGLVALGCLTAVAGGAFWGWRIWSAPQDSDHNPVHSANSTASSVDGPAQSAEAIAPAPSAAASALPVWAESIVRAQVLVGKGDINAAVSLLERASERSDNGALMTMLDQVRLASAASGSCRVVALGRPRPFDRTAGVHDASIAVSPDGARVAWIDDADEPGSPRVSVLSLDAALRPRSALQSVTPNASQVVAVRLLGSGEHPALLFAAARDDATSLRVVRLEAAGDGSSAPMTVADASAGFTRAGVATSPKGDTWIAFVDATAGRAKDVYLQRLLKTMDPEGRPVRLTQHGVPEVADGLSASVPDVAFAGDRLMLAYRRETLREYEIVVSALGLSEDVADGRAGDIREKALVVTPTKLKVNAPKLSCSEKLCFVAWRNEPRGTVVAAFEPDAKTTLWSKVFASQGMAVSLATDAAGVTMMVWFDRGRVRMAPLSREGIGETTALGRVHGQQPAPSLVPGQEPGTWLLGWNCFEGGNPELYVARLRCTAP